MSNGHLPNQWFEGDEADMVNNVNDEKQTVLYLKRNGDGQAGIETILKRELQGNVFTIKTCSIGFVLSKIVCICYVF